LNRGITAVDAVLRPRCVTVQRVDLPEGVVPPDRGSVLLAALVGAGYGAGSHLAILGPSRMDYAAGISTVQAIARYVSRFLE